LVNGRVDDYENEKIKLLALAVRYIPEPKKIRSSRKVETGLRLIQCGQKNEKNSSEKDLEEIDCRDAN
jgi:hypothetical protein